MEELQLWCKGISIVTIISGVMLALIPNNKLLSAIKSLTALILLFLFVNPLYALINGDTELFAVSYDAVNEDETVSLAQSQLLDCAEDVLNQQINELFTENSIDAQCNAYIIENDGEAVIEKVTISGKLDEKTKSVIEEKIREMLPTETIIEFSG